MTAVSRREFNQQTVGSLLTLSLLETLYATDAFTAEIKPVTARWLAELDELGRDLKGQKLGQVQWQERVEGLFAKVELSELLKFIEFDKLTKGLSFFFRCPAFFIGIVDYVCGFPLLNRLLFFEDGLY